MQWWYWSVGFTVAILLLFGLVLLGSYISTQKWRMIILKGYRSHCPNWRLVCELVRHDPVLAKQLYFQCAQQCIKDNNWDDLKQLSSDYHGYDAHWIIRDFLNSGYTMPEEFRSELQYLT